MQFKPGRTRLPAAPDGLSEAARKFWKSIVAGWELDPNHLELLRVACQQLDRATQARAAVDEAGSYFTDKFGNIKPHPGLGVEARARKLFIQSLREIGLDAKVTESPRAPHLPRYQPLQVQTRKVG